MTNHGLNLYTYYYLDQADRLANDSLADVNADNFRFQFIWTVGLLTVKYANKSTVIQLHEHVDIVGVLQARSMSSKWPSNAGRIKWLG